MQFKPILGGLVLATTLPMSAFAGSKDKTENIIDALNLEGDRAEQVQEIMNDYHEQRDEVKERAHSQIKELKKQKEQQLEAVLTDEEMDQYESMMEAKKDWHAKHGYGHDKGLKEKY